MFAASGRLMARYCVGFGTMKNFHEIKGEEGLQDLVSTDTYRGYYKCAPLQLPVSIFCSLMICVKNCDVTLICVQLMILCKSQEFRDIQLRTNEKRALNTLNKDKNRATIRYCVNIKYRVNIMYERTASR